MTCKDDRYSEKAVNSNADPALLVGVVVVDFTEIDEENPQNWSKSSKWTIVILSSLLPAISQLQTVIAAPSTPQILQDFNSNELLYQTLIVSIWELGEVVGPLIYAPLSEFFGRAIVMHICNGLLIIFTVGTALSVNIQMLIAFRFLSGVVVAANAICPAIIGDMFTPEERANPMALLMLGGFVGPAVGPIVGSYIGQAKGWRWSFWIAAILNGAAGFAFLLLYRETYKVTVLSRKARALQRNHSDIAVTFKSKYGLDDQESLRRTLFKSCLRPMIMLFTSPVLAVLTLYVGVANGYAYLVMTVIAPIFQQVYLFTQGQSGLAFLGLMLGLIFGVLFCGYIFDMYIKKLKTSVSVLTPEMRLPPAVFSGLIAPAGFLLFGWTVEYHVHWIVPIIATGFIGFAYIAVSMATRMYIVDCFGIHTVSAMSANLVVKNIAAAVLPLAAPPMYASRLGYGWGNSVLALVAFLLVPIPLLLMRCGERLRSMGAYKVVE